MTDPHTPAHLRAAAAARLHPHHASWGRALAWWQHAAALAPALPLGLAADLGWLLTDPRAAVGNGHGPPDPRPPSDPYPAFLRDAAAAAAARTARALHLGDVAVAALLAHLAQGAPIPAVYRLPMGVSPATAAVALAEALSQPWEDTTPEPPPPSLLDHLLDRLRALTPADVRFLHEVGAGALGLTELADLRALTDLLALPPLHHALLEEVLAFLPALAETGGGSEMQTYAVDGIGGLTRRGHFDMVLPSEWALPDDLLIYRYANHELLYYGRERPPERLPTLLLLVVQGSDAMTGDADAMARASTLALAKAGRARGAEVRVAWFDRVLHPPVGVGCQ